MKIAVWHSGHAISDRVCDAVCDGLPDADLIWSHSDNYTTKIKDYDLHIAYGILRGCGEVFKQAGKHKIPWVNIDKGYFQPGHYSGYYRISLNGTQQTFGLDKLEPDYERWDALGIEVLPECSKRDLTLVCPQTEHVREFFGSAQWPNSRKNSRLVIKSKSDPEPIDYSIYDEVITFNSSVGWEALRQGIPVVSDPEHSILGAYSKLVDKMWYQDYEQRRRFFAIQAGLQLTLPEVRSGLLWPLIQKLICAAQQ